MKQEIHVEDMHRILGISKKRIGKVCRTLLETTNIGKLITGKLGDMSLVELMSNGEDNISDTFDMDSVCIGMLYNGLICAAMDREHISMNKSYCNTHDHDTQNPDMN